MQKAAFIISKLIANGWYMNSYLKEIEMKKLKYKQIVVELYTDEQEYVNDFFAPPEGAILDIESLPESAGFANIETNTISIFKNKVCSFDDLLSTVAHELGHLITGGFKDNPPQKEKYDYLHEKKAEHYEQFTVDSYQIAKMVYAETFK